MSFLDLYTAKQKLKLKNCVAATSFVSTVWRGEVIMLTYSSVSSKIENIFSNQLISEEDFSELNKLVAEFVEG